MVFFVFILTEKIYCKINRKASDSTETVINKIYPKTGKFEISLPSFGKTLNEAFVDTYLIQGSLGYFWNENTGFHLDITMGLPVDKFERQCLENFYNNPDGIAPSACADPEASVEEKKGSL